MDNDNTQGMRVSLPPGTKLTGEKGTYTVKKFICMSTRSATVLCETANGYECRLKIFNGQHGINNGVERKVMSVQTKGVILPSDIGEYGGIPFAVYRNVDATDTSKYPISQNILVRKIIPQMAYVIEKYHHERILLRDICPENVLYRVREQQIAYCGFSNMTVLADRATITKAPGFGQHESFVAPEVPRCGYSTSSDYYSLGVTILSMLLGKNPMQNMKWNEIQKFLSHGKVPGIDVNHMKNTSYELYSADDKILYLVLGLMLPNPKDRWGYGEIRCWCNNQYIPLIRKEGRITYQNNAPFIVNKKKCWNYQQLTQTIAEDKSAWTDVTFKQLEQYAKQQNIVGWNRVIAAAISSSFTPNGRIFRVIYGINPAQDGFWWKGEKYSTAYDLVREAAVDQASVKNLSEILKEQCLSYFMKMRKRITSISESEICDAEQLEQWEIEESGKGMNRCIMRFSDSAENRFFQIEQKRYKSIDQLIECYSNAGQKLKSMSLNILNNKSFQAWLWAKGREDIGTEAQKMASSYPEQSFYMLLQIAESAGETEKTKEQVRKLYLTYGEYAPIYWLANNIEGYRMVSAENHILYDSFKKTGFILSEPLEKLSSELRQLVSDYQLFVTRTAKSPLEVECIHSRLSGYSYYPLKEDGFFCCTWENGLEVSPAFLRSVGECARKETLKDWIDTSITEVDEKLNTTLSELPVFSTSISKSSYFGQCNLNIEASIIMITAAVIGLIIMREDFDLSVIGTCFAALIFPVYSLFWYYQKKARAGIYFNQKQSSSGSRLFYQGLKDSLPARGRDIVQRISNNSAGTITFYQTDETHISDAILPVEPLDLSCFARFTGALSAIGLFSLYGGRSELHVMPVINSVLIMYLMLVGRISRCSRWACATGLLLVPVIITNVYENGFVFSIIVEFIIAGIVIGQCK